MLFWAVVALITASLLLQVWRFCMLRRNQTRALQVARWLERSLTGQGHVVGVKRLNNYDFNIPLRLRSSRFKQSTILLTLTPPQVPWPRVLRRSPRSFPTLTFQADLDPAPGFQTAMFCHTWCATTHQRLSPDLSCWNMHASPSFAIASREDWSPELPAVMAALAQSRQREELMEVAFSATSPHFSAVIPLDAVTLTPNDQGSFFSILAELAAEASASQR